MDSNQSHGLPKSRLLVKYKNKNGDYKLENMAFFWNET